MSNIFGKTLQEDIKQTNNLLRDPPPLYMAYRARQNPDTIMLAGDDAPRNEAERSVYRAVCPGKYLYFSLLMLCSVKSRNSFKPYRRIFNGRPSQRACTHKPDTPPISTTQTRGASATTISHLKFFYPRYIIIVRCNNT